jgi:hypothetical protein
MEWSSAMQQQRSRFKQSLSLKEYFAEEAKLLRDEAKLLPQGAVREAVIRKAEREETASRWVAALAGLQPPK